MRLIVISPKLAALGPGYNQTLERNVRKCMERKHGHINSNSGMTASIAMNYCERMGLPYQLTHDQGMYFIKRTT
jgi:hypothetical protein